MINTVISNYQILEKIGEGGMGTVYKGLDLNLDRPVAMKILHPHLLADPSIIERFRTEARTLANLNHQSLATLYNFVSYQETFCMVMEYVEGRTLTEIMDCQERLPLEKVQHYITQILDGLDHAHQQGIIHRDVKPSNILITNDDQVKVMDFGIARIIGSQRFTRTGTMIGTIQYMAPEQIKGEEGDKAADIYAVGTVLYEMLTGKLPYPETNEYAVIQKKVTEDPINPTAIAPTVPSAWSRITMKALQNDPSRRYSSASHFVQALTNVKNDDSSSEIAFVKNISSGKSKTPKLILRFVLMLLGIIGAIGYGMSTRGETASEINSGDLESSQSWSASLPSPGRERVLIVPPGALELDQVTTSKHRIDSLYSQAVSLYQQKQWLSPADENVLLICRKIIQNEADHAGANELLQKMAHDFEETGDSLVEEQEYSDAMQCYEKSLKCKWSERVMAKKIDIRENALKVQIKIPSAEQNRPLKIKVKRKANTKADISSEIEAPKESEETDIVKSKKTETEKEEEMAQTDPVNKSQNKIIEETQEEPQITKKPINIYVASGQDISLSLDRTISSERQKVGERITFSVNKELVVKGETIIAKGDQALGEITQARSIRDNNKAIIEIQIHSVSAVNGKKISLKANTFRIIGKRNETAQILKGQIFEVKTQRDCTLTIS